MTRARKLRPVVAPVVDQCSAPVSSPNWTAYYLERRAKRAREHDWDGKRCLHQASYEIDGIKYCKAHAGAVALGLLMD